MKRSLLFLLGLGLAFSRMPTMLVNKYLVTFLFLLSLLLPGCENQRRGDGDDDDSSTSDDDDSSTTDDDDFSNDDDSSPNLGDFKDADAFRAANPEIRVLLNTKVD